MLAAKRLWTRGGEALVLLLSLWLALIPAASAADRPDANPLAVQRLESERAPQLVLPEAQFRFARADLGAEPLFGSSPPPDTAPLLTPPTIGTPPAKEVRPSRLPSDGPGDTDPHDRFSARAPPLS